ncbi:MAG: major capsid protein [Microvirus sp.]|nr:MAG: major capsid protein [Microvirus sp.]
MQIRKGQNQYHNRKEIMKLAHRKKYNENRTIKYPKSTFDLSHSHQGSYDWGRLYPIFVEEASPGDYFNLSQQMVAKMMPTIAPIQHEINAFTHYFFVPYRLLDENWEDFYTGGPDGQNEYTLPYWDPDANDKTVGSLWDHMGFPLTDCTGVEPIVYPLRAYNLIWSEYYRDENLQEVREPQWETPPSASTSAGTYRLCKRAWEKDYFTAALPWQQRGIAPALPITGITSALWKAAQFDTLSVPAGQGMSTGSPNYMWHGQTPDGAANMMGLLNNNQVDLGEATTFDVADIRAAVQIQRWMERNARGGARYTEVIENHFDESPRDDRLQRPEYIGGWRQQITITEVLQVSQTATTPQGTRTGLGSVYGGGYVGSYKVLEPGIIIGLASIMPRSMYTQGVNRMFLRRTRYDFLWPEFVNLSEQAILTAEIFASADSATNQEIFGYQGRYDELRQRNSRAVGLLRSSTSGLIHWNLSRKFATAPALNEEFIEIEIDELKQRVFAVPSEPGFIITFGNICSVERALPMIAEPGMLDHI